MDDVVQGLKDQISAGKIIFDAGSEAKLKSQLLGENSETKVTAKLQALVLKLSNVRESGSEPAGPGSTLHRSISLGAPAISIRAIGDVELNTFCISLTITPSSRRICLSFR